MEENINKYASKTLSFICVSLTTFYKWSNSSMERGTTQTSTHYIEYGIAGGDPSTSGAHGKHKKSPQ